eukprot:4458436-Pleurochrysis_carterae.AAC.2
MADKAEEATAATRGGRDRARQRAWGACWTSARRGPATHRRRTERTKGVTPGAGRRHRGASQARTPRTFPSCGAGGRIPWGLPVWCGSWSRRWRAGDDLPPPSRRRRAGLPGRRRSRRRTPRRRYARRRWSGGHW